MKRKIAVALALSFTALWTNIVQGGASVTFGDVNSHFNTFLHGVELSSGSHPSASSAAPADGFLRGRIFPLFQPTEPYCESDWIVVAIGIFEPKSSFSNAQEAAESFSAVTFEYSLNLIPQDAMRTPTRGQNYDTGGGSMPIWYENTGFFIEPGSLPVGTHLLETTTSIEGVGSDTAQIWFEIRSADDPACVE